MSGYFQKIRKLFKLSTDRSDKRYELDGEDRVEWEAIWSRQSHRKLDLPLKVEGFHSINKLQSSCGKIVTATISEEPVEFSDQVIRENESCPICGWETTPTERVAVSIHPEFQNGVRNIAIGVWVHKDCFQSCSIIEGPAPIPW